MLGDGEIISRNIYFLELSCPDAPCFFTWSRRQLFWIELFARRIEDALAMARDGVDPEFRLDKKRIFEIEEDRKTKDPAAYNRIVAEAPLYRLGRLQFRKISDGGSTGYAGDGVTLRPTTPGGPYRLLSDGADGSSIWLRSSRFVNVTYSPQRLSEIDEYLRGLTSILSIEAECFMSWGVINVNGSGSVLYLDLDNGENVQQIFLPHGSYEIYVSTWTNPHYPLKVIGAFSMQNHEPTIDVWRPRAVTRANPVNANAQSN
jgi:hypothetical protein